MHTLTARDLDTDLMARIADGDSEQAMAELYDRYGRRVYGLGVSTLNDRQLAEELVQETFVRVWRSAAGFDPTVGTAPAFLFTLARRVAIDMHRRRPAPTSEMPELADGAADRFDRLVEELALREAIAGLPPRHRSVLELAYFDDMTQDAIGEQLGVPTGTVKSRTHTALRALREALDAQGAWA